jgi:hypothetical protein
MLFSCANLKNKDHHIIIWAFLVTILPSVVPGLLPNGQPTGAGFLEALLLIGILHNERKHSSPDYWKALDRGRLNRESGRRSGLSALPYHEILIY